MTGHINTSPGTSGRKRSRRMTTPWRDRGDYYVLPDDPLGALNVLREAAGLEPLPDDDNLPSDHDD